MCTTLWFMYYGFLLQAVFVCSFEDRNTELRIFIKLTHFPKHFQQLRLHNSGIENIPHTCIEYNETNTVHFSGFTKLFYIMLLYFNILLIVQYVSNLGWIWICKVTTSVFNYLIIFHFSITSISHWSQLRFMCLLRKKLRITATSIHIDCIQEGGYCTHPLL